MSDIIERIFPEQSIHLVAGPTGAGKTRWLIEMLLEWEQGHPVFGFRSNPRPWLYVSGDRPMHQARATIQSLGIDPARVPILEAFGIVPPIGVLEILETAEKRNAGLLVWEGFGNYVESNWGSSKVKQWLNMITWRLWHKQDGSKRSPLTIIGVMEQPKMRPKDKYANPRQRISGPAAWGHTAETIVIIEHADETCQNDLRRIGIFPHTHGGPMEFRATLETGHFVLLPPEKS